MNVVMIVTNTQREKRIYIAPCMSYECLDFTSAKVNIESGGKISPGSDRS